MGGLTQEHVLFTRDRFSLPPEDRARLEAIHLSLGEQFGGLSPQDVLSLLDCPALEAGEIEDLIAARARRATENIRLAAPPAPPRMVHPAPPVPASQPPAPPAVEDWMPSASLYDRYIADRQSADRYAEDQQHGAARARAGP